MSNTKRGLKALGLSLMAAMGLMAFTAAGAQAITWDINGAEIGANNSNVTGNIVAGTTGLLLVPAQNLVIHCSKFTVEEGTLMSVANNAHAKLKYSECSTTVKGVKSPGCTPEILAVTAKILPILHNSKVYLLVEPLTAGQPFTTIHYNEETCALPPLPTVTGSVVFQCYTGALVAADCKTARIKQTIMPAPAALFPTDVLKYGLNESTIHGEGEVFLKGADAGKTFNALI